MIVLHLGCDDDIRPGCINMDPKIDGWKFEHGLLRFATRSVDAITISHALMYVREYDWRFVFSEFFRVLKSGGVVRITEDDTENATSPRHTHPWAGAATLTGPRMTRKYLTRAGFGVSDMPADTTNFANDLLLIAHREHKVQRYVYYIEGVKP